MAGEMPENAYSKWEDVDAHLLEGKDRGRVDSDPEEEYEEQPDEEEVESVHSLFDNATFTSAEECVAQAKDTYNLDLKKACSALGGGFYGAVKLVNFLRQCKEDRRLPWAEEPCETDEDYRASVKSLSGETVLARLSELGSTILTGDTYLQPVVASDPLLQHVALFQDDVEDEEGG
eukprot:CAMPEP_0119130872 /NCGR_PEP_ID=MMETSP1310-20130426/9015_1 /TAXON_ID=464262 /ORGANISM="Genus nov. species nov., Strain RCC2339" /LENGTH=175 /DNA_ID=CAMNT_0007121411 /DNA_START=60 /DNA_END=583 /DNA_ORIENTATION=-